MTDVYRITAVWNGFTGSPGYTRLSFQGLTDAASLNSAGAAVAAFFTGINPYLRSSWSIQVQGAVQIYDMALGHLTSEVTMNSVPAAVTGTLPGTQVFAGGAGAHVNWITGLILSGHRVRGRTYLVPMANVAEADGTLSTASITAIQAAANALIGGQSGKFSVWSRTFSKDPKPIQIGGGIAPVTSAVVPDKTGILKSRRD